MNTKYIVSLIIAALVIFLHADLGFAAGKGWYWFMNLGGKKTEEKTTGTSNKKDTTEDKDKSTDNKSTGTVPQPQTQEET